MVIIVWYVREQLDLVTIINLIVSVDVCILVEELLAESLMHALLSIVFVQIKPTQILCHIFTVEFDHTKINNSEFVFILIN